ncbi:GNAT family N-acetyltransferase [Defluviitalea raffinosedens]|uniref:GNAT family N-acetyltransferase n=1 Tax=Defluviitalea raffinosedens TaxID=1450156 RepID=A0A7C8LQG8_9FIRM|nr:N-acetyltransferase [Defluviitalea raffinosedens]KAE9635001.1 GNAT family N-acetyltransferase [Defluviitalea raffinosedens]MBM7686930.1 ribosomal protein S18 acetylase RimI-like enzyme [Defluviitalea raffinosedens]
MIRKAIIKDAEIITEFNYCLAKETEDLELNRETLFKGVQKVLSDESKGIYFVYEKDEKIVGQLMITKEWSDWRNGDFWWIQSVYVHKDYRRQGIYTALFNHVKSIVDSDDTICGLRLYVEKENEAAKNTYKALGMKETYYLLYELSSPDKSHES